jgi:hypothetical protein
MALLIKTYARVCLRFARRLMIVPFCMVAGFQGSPYFLQPPAMCQLDSRVFGVETPYSNGDLKS